MLIRYLTLEKFEWLLCDLGIYIGAASDQSDENEGIYDSKIMSEVLRPRISNISEMKWDALDRLAQSQMQNNRARCYLSSWYLGEVETREMWDEYGSDGVALISDENLLISELPKPLGNAASFYKVIYDNSIKMNAVNDPLEIKEEKFQHENEYRLVIDMLNYSILTGFEKERFGIVYVGDVPSYQSPDITCCMSPQGMTQSHRVIRKKGAGYVISFDLGRLVREIRLHPECTEENKLSIKKSLKAAGIKIVVQNSTLKTTSGQVES